VKQAIAYISKYLSEFFVAAILTGAVAINYFIPAKIAFLDLFYLLVVLAGYYIGRKFAVLGAFLAILLIGYYILAYQEEYFVSQTPMEYQLNFTVWASFLILAAYLIGTLTENLRRELEESNRLREDLRRDRELLNMTNARLNDYAGNLEEKVTDRIGELEKANRDLREFAAYASHDLKEPLRKITAFSEMIETQHPEAAGEINSFLNRMKKAVTRMENLIDGLLKFSGVSGGSNKMMEMTDLNRVVQEVIQDLEVRVVQTRAEIKTQDLPSIECDPFQMQLLFRNLISNSLKYCRSDVAPQICIEGRRKENGDLEIVVKDNGIGIEKEFLEKIFKPFERLHPASKIEGSGIGLAICQRVVECHHGTLIVESEPGGGTRFIINLPEVLKA